MAEYFDHIPRNPQKWTEKAPLLGKWLWVLFWMAIPHALSSLLNSDLFGPEPVFRFLYYFVPQYVFKYLGILMQLIYFLGCGLALLKLSSAMDRYRTAGICYLIAGAINIVFSIIPVPAVGSGLAVLVSLVSLVSSIALLIGEYHEYRGHNELLEDVNPALSVKWRILWKWYIGCFIALIGSIVVMLLSPVFGLMVSLTAAVVLVAVLVFKLIYLYRTAMVFRRWDPAAPLQSESGGTEGDSPDKPQ